MVDSSDGTFRALADPTRRRLLDRLFERNGQTLNELCEGLVMARQSATQHLGILEAANLISTIRHGREKLHYLNPVPIQELQTRWIGKFEQPRLQALQRINEKAEHAMTHRPNFRYVTYIAATPEKVWHALTDAELTASYWGHANVSDWQPGSRWEHRRTDGSGIADCDGTVVEAIAPSRLVITFEDPNVARLAVPSQVTFEIEAFGDIARLTVTHVDLPTDHDRDLAASGWAAVLSNLKSLLETGHVLPQRPWEMP